MYRYTKLFLSGVLIVIPLLANAQDGWTCGSKNPDQEKQKLLPSYHIMNEQNNENAWLASYPGTKYRFKVAVHYLTVSGGDDVQRFIQQDLDSVNMKFDMVNFEFILCKFNKINVPQGFVFTVNEERTEDEAVYCDANDVPGHINIYYAPGLIWHEDDNIFLHGRADFPEADKKAGNPFGNRIIINSHMSYHVLVHEMGHFFNLYHTDAGIGPYEYANGVECSTMGDKVCDTPPEPYIAKKDASNFDRYCKYIGASADRTGYPYTPLTNNFMTQGNVYCMHSFTPGQAKRMQVSGWADRLAISYNADFSYAITGNFYKYSISIPPFGNTIEIKVPVNTVSATILTSSSVISGGSDIRYYADEKIILKKGFKASSDSKFRARIVDICDMPVDGGGMATARKAAHQYTSIPKEDHGIEEVKILPNPSNGSGRVNFYTSDADQVEVIIYDLYGKVVYSKSVRTPNEGHHSMDFDLQGSPSGLYSVRLTIDGKTTAGKLVITQ